MESENSVPAIRDENLPAFVNQDGKRGADAALDKEDLIIPRLQILQKTSKLIDDPSGDFRPGEMVHSVSTEKYDNPLPFLPIYQWVEWLHWDKETYELLKTCRSADEAEAYMPGGTKWTRGDDGDTPPVLTKTFKFLILPLTTMEPVILSLASTSLKAGRQLANLIRMKKGDSFSHKYALSVSIQERGSNRVAVAEVRALGLVGQEDEAAYRMCEKCYEEIVPLIRDGRVQDEAAPAATEESADF